MSAACLEQGPLFSANYLGADTNPSGAGEAGNSSGAPSPAAAAPSESPPYEAGLTPTEGLPAREPSDAPAEPARDAGSVASPPAGDAAQPQDACDACLAGVCPAAIEGCAATAGCAAIVACARSSGCVLDECYCGNVNAFLCTTTRGNGPCRDVMLSAPGAHLPSFVDPTTGPAAVAAGEVGQCRIDSDECRAACGG